MTPSEPINHDHGNQRRQPLPAISWRTQLEKAAMGASVVAPVVAVFLAGASLEVMGCFTSPVLLCDAIIPKETRHAMSWILELQKQQTTTPKKTAYHHTS